MVKKKIYVIALALLVLFSALCGTVGIYNAEAIAAETKPRVLYYYKCASFYPQEEEAKITEKCAGFKNDKLIDEFHVLVDDISWFPHRVSEEGYFEKFMNPAEVAKQKAYLVFEFDKAPEDGEAEYIAGIFREMKEVGSKIMFICKEDENYFKDYNEFLDYVDIHINKDRYDDFLLNVIYRIFYIFGNSFQWEHVTFILNKNMHTFLEEKIYPILKKQYEKPDDYSMEALFNELNIKILFYDANCEFADINGEKIYPEREEFLDYFQNERIFAVGANFGEKEYDEAWQNTIDGIKNDYGLSFPFFQYEEDVHDNSTIPTYLCHGPYDVTFIIEDFLRDNDLTIYDNWDGRCVVTHKTVIYGDNGWMLQFGEGDGFFDFIGALWYGWEE